MLVEVNYEHYTVTLCYICIVDILTGVFMPMCVLCQNGYFPIPYLGPFLHHISDSSQILPMPYNQLHQKRSQNDAVVAVVAVVMVQAMQQHCFNSFSCQLKNAR